MAKPGGQSRNLLSWIAVILLAVIFLSEGAAKFPASRLWLRVFDQIGFGQWFRYFTGVVEIAGALLLVVPATRFVGAALLACTMGGALLVHALIMGIGPPTAGVVVLLLLLVAIGVDSFKQRRAINPN
jgi:putative oxidoreductase